MQSVVLLIAVRKSALEETIPLPQMPLLTTTLE